MSLIDTAHKRKSLTITILIMGIVTFLLFFAGLKYLDPPPENGIDVIYGVDLQGMGERTPPPSASKPQTAPPETVTKPEETSSEEPKENLLAQDNDEEIAVPTEPKKQEKKKESPKKEKPKENTKKEVTEKPKEEPKPSKETTDALSSILGAANAGGNASGGQGDDNIAGYKGSPDGNPYANSYYGSGGSGTGGKGWGLKGRSIQVEGYVPQECNESGTIVVQIEVDRDGKVVKATPGVKGSTSREPCLLDAARKTAFKHKWNADSNAPARQVGFIVINFKLGE
ncbi:energy transducer TonB [Capnocytophaga sp.]|uniref:energy transducer TonB n=1 Tax=Capnocytophaga sp. TaxID=44737 RepID=UPI0026DB3FC7|nr:energy transducer TonB [Capnocytophaga sp.]MDO5105563.1 energy transducer TonB [Capnocytophaga sp.]